MPSSRSETPQKRSRRSGAHMSSKQLAATVMKGQQVTFATTVNDVTGYLCGMDDYHWMVVSPSGEITLVHKAQTPVITISNDKTYASEPKHEALEKIVGPFREHVIRTYYGRTVSVPRNDQELAQC